MNTIKQFEILIKQKIPFVSNFLYILLIFLLSMLFIYYVVMSPALHSQSSAEMQTAYYILVVPDSLKKLSAYSLIGLLIIVPLYYRARSHKNALLIFADEKLIIRNNKEEIEIPFQRIKKVFCNDLHSLMRKPKEKLQIVIQERSQHTTSFLLKDYESGGALIEKFATLPNIEIAGYDNEILTEYLD